MNSVRQFEDLLVWQKSKILYITINRIFKDSKDFYFRDQIRRAALSIMNNIAEGFERFSTKEYIRFLFIAKGSCGEVRSMLTVAYELEAINQEQCNELKESCLEISRMLAGLIKSL